MRIIIWFLVWPILVRAMALKLYRLIKKIHYLRKAKKLKFLQIKTPRKLVAKSTDMAADEHTQSMEQNIQLMNQILKSFASINNSSTRELGFFNTGIGRLLKKNFMDNYFGDDYISLEFYVSKEMIKFVIGVPGEYLETFEKMIWAFYPGAVVEDCPKPSFIDPGKCAAGWYLALTHDTIYPIKTYETFKADPMDSILSAFNKVWVDDIISLQILARELWDSHHKRLKKKLDDAKEGKEPVWFLGSFAILISNMIYGKPKDDPKTPHKNLFSSQQQADMDKKIEDELFETVIRVVAVSPSQSQADILVQDVARSLIQYNYTGLNGFELLKTTSDKFRGFLKKHAARYFGHQFSGRYRYLHLWYKQILNIKELSSLYHFPHSLFNKNPRITWQKYKIVPAPENVPTEWLLLGYNIYGWVKKEIRLQDMDRFRHFYCIGQTGTGKTTMLLVQAKEDMLRGRGFCFIDPHGDFCEDMLWYFPKERIDDLIYFNAADFEYPIGFNAFEAGTDEERDVVTSDLVDMFVMMYGEEIFWPRIQDYFRNAALTLMEQPDGGTLCEIVRLFVDPAYQMIKVKNVQNPVVKTRRAKTYNAMWDREKAEMIPYFQAKFSPFVTTPIVRNIIGQPKSSFYIADAMQQNKVILVNLSKWLLWETNAQLIGRMIVTQIKVAALKRASMDISERVPFYLYIDEFQNYISKSIESILSEARKYRLWLAVAHQYIDQLRGEWLWGKLDLSKAIFGNVGSIMSYKVWPEDAEFLEKLYGPEFDKSDLVSMDKFKGVLTLSVDTQPTRPFSLTVLNPFADKKLNSPEKVAVMKQISALKRGRKRELVEKEIFYRVGV